MSTQSQLRIYNSLTRSKEVFQPINGNQVKLYICGPTVYDSAHMGHARAYLSFDILRRVFSSYFNYDVLWTMNITNIDDKIIKRARQNYLYDEYLKESKANIRQVLNDVSKALSLFQVKYQKETDPDKQNMMKETLNRVNATVRLVEEDLLKDNSTDLDGKSEQLIHAAKDVLFEWLDSEKGSSVNDIGVFSALADKYEDDFFGDMQALNVKPPDVLTRVSDYMPEILDFVQGIVDRGYGYRTSDGSVYFDTEAFSRNPSHTYAKLMPESYSDKENAQKFMQESEGVLSADQNLMEKKSSADFALWKSSKPGEPSWQSQFGDDNRRPGWHIECSAMSTAIFGPTLDIHAGGTDLKFPHHDNEIAQCEAYYDKDGWVNYFLHCGSLRIEGLKMSKSLKNFITIKEALKTYTARQIRLLFLMHNMCDCLDYSAQTMERALQFEKFSNEFFLNVKDLLRRNKSTSSADVYHKYEEAELDLLKVFLEIKAKIHEALCDSIDTRLVIEKMRELINASNVYIKDKTASKASPDSQLLNLIGTHLTSLLSMFGVISEQERFGYPSEDGPGCAADRESLLMPYLNTLAEFRSSVRTMARKHKNADILEECDKIRDAVLPRLGVRFEDHGDSTVIKLVDPETLIREQEQKKALQETRRLEKERNKLEMERNKLEKERKQREKEEKKSGMVNGK